MSSSTDTNATRCDNTPCNGGRAWLTDESEALDSTKKFCSADCADEWATKQTSTMNTPNRNTVVKMILEQIGDMEFEHQYPTHLDELGDAYFNGGIEDYDDLAYWENIKEFKERVWDKHVSAQFDFMQLWHDELDTELYTIDWLFGITSEHHIPFELPIIVSFMMQEANAFGQRLMEVHENEASLIKIQALVRGRNTRWRIPCFGFDNKIADYDSISLFPSKVYHD